MCLRVMQAKRPEQRAVLRYDRNGPCRVQSVLQCHPPILLCRAGPEWVSGDVRADHRLFAKRRGAARRHGWPNWQRSNQLLVVLGDPPSRRWPKMLAAGIRQKDAGDEIRIEHVNPVTECAEDVLKRSAANNQFERSLVDGRQ